MHIEDSRRFIEEIRVKVSSEGSSIIGQGR